MYNLNSEQKKAVEHTGSPLLIIAGAGTGKTTVITQKIGWLIEQGLAKSDEILALTFTEKAAGEMSERADTLLPYGYVDLWIMTFHSFAEKILQQHGLDIGLPTNFKLLNEFGQWALIKKIWKSLIWTITGRSATRRSLFLRCCSIFPARKTKTSAPRIILPTQMS